MQAAKVISWSAHSRGSGNPALGPGSPLSRGRAEPCASALAALAARGRVRLETVSRIVSVPLDADHRQDDDAAAVIARLGQSGADGAPLRRECDHNSHVPLPRRDRSAGSVHMIKWPTRLTLR